MQVIAIGGDKGKLSLLDLRSKKVEQTVHAHSARIRGVAALSSTSGQTAEGSGDIAAMLGTASTDGRIRLWDLRRPGELPAERDAVALTVQTYMLAAAASRQFRNADFHVSK